jgi:hypothetical protein
VEQERTRIGTYAFYLSFTVIDRWDVWGSICSLGLMRWRLVCHHGRRAEDGSSRFSGRALRLRAFLSPSSSVAKRNTAVTSKAQLFHTSRRYSSDITATGPSRLPCPKCYRRYRPRQLFGKKEKVFVSRIHLNSLAKLVK